MAEIGPVSFASCNLENLFEVQRLRRADNVPKSVALQVIDPIINCRNVAGRVIESAVALANDCGLVRQFRNIPKENTDRALADLSQSFFEQAVNHARQPLVIKTFAADNVVMNVE